MPDDTQETLLEEGQEPVKSIEDLDLTVAAQKDDSAPAKPATPAPASDAPAEPVEPKPASVTLDSKSMAELAATLQKATQPPAPAEPPLTPEQVKQLLNTFEAGEKDVEELGLPATAAAKLNAVLQAVVKQAVTAATLHTEMVRRQLSEMLTPLQAMQREQAMAKLQDEFFATHDDLRGKEKVVELVYTKLDQQGWKPKNKQEAFDTVAKEARQLIQEYLSGPGASAENGSQPPRAAGAVGGRKMPTVLAGGQAGSVAKGDAAPDKEKAFNKWLLDM